MAPEGKRKQPGGKKRSVSKAPAVSGTVAIGTYDGALLVINAHDGRQVFGYAPHIGCVKALHCSEVGRLASGGTDNVVRLFNLAKGVELGELQEHEDTVTSLEYWGTTTLVSGGADGQLCIWRCRDFELLYKCKAHKTGIVAAAVHPSGRLAATAGKDASIRLWDLSRGTSAAHLTIETAAEELVWSPTGKAFAVLSQKELLLVETDTSDLVKYQDPAPKGSATAPLTAVCFITDDAMVVGDGKGSLRVFRRNADKSSLVEAFALQIPEESSASVGRVKAIARFPESQGQCAFAVGTSTGRIEIWHCPTPSPADKLTAAMFRHVRSIDTGARLTCLAVWAGLAHNKSQEDEAQVKSAGLALKPLSAQDVGAKVVMEEDGAAADGKRKKQKKSSNS